MAYITELDGPALAAWARCAALRLEERSPEINRLNVFPIPDSDTGSNMAHTMQAAVSELSLLPQDATAAQVTSALTRGASAGARGNSGMVLAQVLRSLAESPRETLRGPEVTAALNRAFDLVHGAIAQPVEGTILSVTALPLRRPLSRRSFTAWSAPPPRPPTALWPARLRNFPRSKARWTPAARASWCFSTPSAIASRPPRQNHTWKSCFPIKAMPNG
ncbi:DAK2 domain-containing protein [Corynebacterium lowii]|uniref:DAK2 domain-containing protein n=1 Tax=Corynebacterium lowii TaxID=1544413 RepID=UPI0009EB1721|nr:DAK2 domain-containing protein [Corynebacterium lowii]